MNVAFVSRSTLYSGKGGDTIQILRTADYLRERGINVDIFLSSDAIDYDKYDIMHGFNVIRPADLIKHFNRFKKHKVLSTIYVDYSDYEKNARKGFVGKVFNLIGADMTEYLKTCLRWVKNGEKNFSFQYLFGGHGNAVRSLIKASNILLPNSNSEYNRLLKSYGIAKRYAVIPNGIDHKLFKESYDITKKQKNLVICVARIDGRKNQLNLIRALNDTEFELLIIGKSAPNHIDYYNQCRAEAKSNVNFITEVEQEELIQYYLKAKVHAMPSWFETTGLSSLEAIAMGCNIVIAPNGDTPEYFGDKAYYSAPDSVEGIYNAVKKAADANFDLSYRALVYSNYTWEKTADETLNAYKSLT